MAHDANYSFFLRAQANGRFLRLFRAIVAFTTGKPKAALIVSGCLLAQLCGRKVEAELLLRDSLE
jgi:hypothetical protein